MRGLSSLRRSSTVLCTGLLLAVGLVLAPTAQAATSSYISVGPFQTQEKCLKVQRTYSSSWTRIVYSCYSFSYVGWVFVYAPR